MARILLIEDDVELQKMLAMALVWDGHKVFQAFTGKEGFEQCMRFLPDILLLDLMLPRVNGIELLRLLQVSSLTSKIPVIVITAHAQRAEELRGKDEARNVKACLIKPFDLDALDAAIRDALGQR